LRHSGIGRVRHLASLGSRPPTIENSVGPRRRCHGPCRARATTIADVGSVDEDRTLGESYSRDSSDTSTDCRTVERPARAFAGFRRSDRHGAYPRHLPEAAPAATSGQRETGTRSRPTPAGHLAVFRRRGRRVIFERRARRSRRRGWPPVIESCVSPAGTPARRSATPAQHHRDEGDQRAQDTRRVRRRRQAQHDDGEAGERLAERSVQKVTQTTPNLRTTVSMK